MIEFTHLSDTYRRAVPPGVSGGEKMTFTREAFDLSPPPLAVVGANGTELPQKFRILFGVPPRYEEASMRSFASERHNE